jgi:hypothetical protein
VATFSDDFNRADSSSLGAGWVEVSGDWSIVSGRLSSGSAGGTIILRAAGAMDGSDNYAQVTIAVTAAVSHGVWCRGDSTLSNGYLLRNDGTEWTLFWVVGGSFNPIGSYAAAAVDGDVVRIQAVGSTIKGFINGIERISVTDTAVTTGTSVGIRAESVGTLRFDDFAAGDVTAGATLGTASSTEAAQALTGSKSAPLGIATEAEAAQTLTGAKAGTLAPATASEAAQALAGSKTGTLGAAAEVGAPQALTGSKAATLPAAAETETAQPLTGAKSQGLGAADSVEAAQALTGSKSAVLVPAAETDTARPLAVPGLDEDLDFVVGAPAGAPYAAGAPQASGWEVGAPC